jgi:hypothetical protein
MIGSRTEQLHEVLSIKATLGVSYSEGKRLVLHAHAIEQVQMRWRLRFIISSKLIGIMLLEGHRKPIEEVEAISHPLIREFCGSGKTSSSRFMCHSLAGLMPANVMPPPVCRTTPGSAYQFNGVEKCLLENGPIGAYPLSTHNL